MHRSRGNVGITKKYSCGIIFAENIGIFEKFSIIYITDIPFTEANQEIPYTSSQQTNHAQFGPIRIRHRVPRYEYYVRNGGMILKKT